MCKLPVQGAVFLGKYIKKRQLSYQYHDFVGVLRLHRRGVCAPARAGTWARGCGHTRVRAKWLAQARVFSIFAGIETLAVIINHTMQ